jgi:hypothetical protein
VVDRIGLAKASIAEGRTTPGRKLIDPGGPVIECLVHRYSPGIETPNAAPDSFFCGLQNDIVGAPKECNVIKRKSQPVQFIGNFGLASFGAPLWQRSTD